jgi:hypothetical protein
MRKYDRTKLIAVSFTLMAFLLTFCTTPSTPVENSEEVANPVSTETPLASDVCSNPVDQPKEAETLAANDPNTFAWKLFLALNCPAQSDQASPLVWETWKPSDLVYLPGGQEPDPWGSPLPDPRNLSTGPEISGYSLKDTSGQPALYEVRMNKSTFQYIVDRTLYSKAGQLEFFNSKTAAPIAFDQHAIEIKAAWLILDPNDKAVASRYHTAYAKYVDENGNTQQALVGLSGFHITSRVVPNWVWITFEQVDNQSKTGIQPTRPIPPEVQTLNDTIHAGLPPDSPWKFYNLQGTQTQFTEGGNPTLLANTLIETNFQNSSSCITCHQLASRGAVTRGRLAMFDTQNGIQGYVGTIDDPMKTYRDAFGKLVCFHTDPGAFFDCKDSTVLAYKLTDFVWSLREAK